MITTIQRVRQLQEEINEREALLAQLAQQPEYIAEQAFIDDVVNVLEKHGRTLKEAVLALDPSLLASAPKTKATRPYKPRKAQEVEHFSLNGSAESTNAAGQAAPVALAAPAAKPEISAKTGKVKRARRAPAPGEGPLSSPAKQAWNQKRNEETRLKAIREGRWFLYTNPHTGETCEGAKVNNDTLRTWAAEYGRGAVDKWKRPLTKAEAESGAPA